MKAVLSSCVVLLVVLACIPAQGIESLVQYMVGIDANFFLGYPSMLDSHYGWNVEGVEVHPMMLLSRGVSGGSEYACGQRWKASEGEIMRFELLHSLSLKACGHT